MKFKLELNLNDEYDVVTLYQMLYNERKEYENDNYRHMDMIELLEGNNSNEKAKGRLRHEKDLLRSNNKKIEFIDNIINQLKPIVDNYFDSRDAKE